MASQGSSVGIGVGVTLGVLALIAILLLALGLCTSRRRQADLEQETQQRRAAVQEQYQREQEQWRERRLRQVVLVLVDRGEAEEGVPLAFKLPNHSEVLARRRLRNIRSSQRARLEEMAEVDPRLDEEALAITRQTLPELLANGRPPDAEPGPDIMQMLLEGQEVRPNPSDEEEENEDEFVDVTPQDTPQTRELDPGTAESHPTQPSASAGRNGNSSDETSFTPPDTEEARRLKREEAIIKELRAERNTTRRRKTADELYGPGVPYLLNPNNEEVDRHLEPADPAGLGSTTLSHEPSSTAFTRFLSPLTPWRGKKHRKGSAFDGQMPSELGNSTRQPPTSPSGPRSHTRQNTTSAFDQANSAADAQSPNKARIGQVSAASSEPF